MSRYLTAAAVSEGLFRCSDLCTYMRISEHIKKSPRYDGVKKFLSSLRRPFHKRGLTEIVLLVVFGNKFCSR